MRASYIFRRCVFAFCTNRLKHLSALNAIYSQLVIDHITQANSSKHGAPLMETIRGIKLPLKYQQYLLKQRYAKQIITEGRGNFMEAFDPLAGTQLPKELISTQQRFFDSINTQGKIFFYPNSIVTTPVFKTLQRTLKIYAMESKDIIVGKPGISKSMGFLLYWHLSSLITAYRYHYVEQCKQLIKNKILKQDGYKFLYVNFNAQKMNLQNFSQFIKFQCPQIKQQIKDYKINKAGDLTQFLQKINKLYKDRNIKCFVVGDQLNALANIFKNYNQLKQKQQKSKFDLEQQTQSYQIIRARYLKIIHFAIRDSIPRIYNSSQNIEQELLGPPSKILHRYWTLDLLRHSPGKIIAINYNENSISEIQNRQIYRFIWYTTAKYLQPYLLPKLRDSEEQKMQKQKEQKQKLQQIKQMIETKFLQACDKAANQHGFSSFITPHTISQVLSKNQNLLQKLLQKNDSNQAKTAINVEKIGDYVQSFVAKLLSKGFLHLKNKAFKFLTEGQISITRLKCKVAFFCLLYLKDNQDKNTITFKEIIEGAGLQPRTPIQSLIDKDVFNITDQNSIQLTLTRQELQKLGFQSFIQIKDTQIISQVLQRYAKQEENKGSVIEFLILSLISLNPHGKITFDQQNYKYKGITYFHHLLGKHPNIMERISPIFRSHEEAKLQPNIYYFGRPRKPFTKNNKLIDNGMAKHSSNNPSFDLIAVRKDENENYEVVSFDFTTNKNKNDLDEKFISAQQLLKSLNCYPTHSEPVIENVEQDYIIKTKIMGMIQNYEFDQNNKQVTSHIQKVFNILENTEYNNLPQKLKQTRPKSDQAKSLKEQFKTIIQSQNNMYSVTERILKYLEMKGYAKLRDRQTQKTNLVVQNQTQKQKQKHQGKPEQKPSHKPMFQNYYFSGNDQLVANYIKNVLKILQVTEYSQVYQKLKQTIPVQNGRIIKDQLLKIVKEQSNVKAIKERMLQYLEKQKQIEYLTKYFEKIKSWQHIVWCPYQKQNPKPTVPKSFILKNGIKLSFRYHEAKQVELIPLHSEKNRLENLNNQYLKILQNLLKNN